jgi:hypothetical protein
MRENRNKLDKRLQCDCFDVGDRVRDESIVVLLTYHVTLDQIT